MHTTTSFDFVGDLPTDPAIYALYGGTGRGRHVAYVGTSSNLRNRIRQHFVRRDSSIVTGTSAASLNPDLVTRLEWWLHERFADTTARRAAELIALEVFEPALRSRGRVTEEAESLSEDPQFRTEMEEFFEEEPTGSVEVPTLSDALDRIQELEGRVSELEEEIRELKQQ